MPKSMYSLTKIDNNTHGQEPYLAGSLDFYTQEQCDSHARAGDQTQVVSRSTLIQHPSLLTACDSQLLPQGKLSTSPRARYTSKKEKTPRELLPRCHEVETLGREISQDGHVLYSEVERRDLAEFLVLVAPDRMLYITRWVKGIRDLRCGCCHSIRLHVRGAGESCCCHLS